MAVNPPWRSSPTMIGQGHPYQKRFHVSPKLQGSSQAASRLGYSSVDSPAVGLHVSMSCRAWLEAHLGRGSWRHLWGERQGELGAKATCWPLWVKHILKTWHGMSRDVIGVHACPPSKTIPKILWIWYSTLKYSVHPQ